MHCYLKDFGLTKVAICEETLSNGMFMTATERVQEDPKPEVWAKLGALIARTGEWVDAQ